MLSLHHLQASVAEHCEQCEQRATSEISVRINFCIATMLCFSYGQLVSLDKAILLSCADRSKYFPTQFLLLAVCQICFVRGRGLQYQEAHTDVANCIPCLFKSTPSDLVLISHVRFSNRFTILIFFILHCARRVV